jgi:site-specific DNA-cytosine methylase
MLVYSLCDYSGEWAKPYKEAGHEVVLVDLKYGQDVRLLLKPDRKVDVVLAAPPCTVFAGSGAKWRSLRAISEVLEGLSIVDACLRFIYATRPKIWALENPVGWLRDYIGEPKLYFDPCDYGDPYTKNKCLWGEFNIPVKTPVEPTEGSKIHLNYGGRSERTKTLRSITPLGFARAFYKANKEL